ncbi:hypothetical protein [Methanorbis furvi]
MTECTTCEGILSGEPGGLKCKLLQYRKYLIGIVIGAVIVFVATRRKK